MSTPIDIGIITDYETKKKTSLAGGLEIT